MKALCCDTSFLMAFYGADAHSARALTALRHERRTLTLSIFNSFELENALRFAAWRGLLTEGDVRTFLHAMDVDLKSGRLKLPPLNLPGVLATARRISAAHTLRHGHRPFDILHVAAALELKADCFLSFDEKQRRLANAEKLTVGP